MTGSFAKSFGLRESRIRVLRNRCGERTVATAAAAKRGRIGEVLGKHAERGGRYRERFAQAVNGGRGDDDARQYSFLATDSAHLAILAAHGRPDARAPAAATDRRRRAGMNRETCMRHRSRIAAYGLNLALAFAAAGACAQTPAARSDAAPTRNDIDRRSFYQRLADAHALARDGQSQQAGNAFAELMAQPPFAVLPDDERRAALAAAGESAIARDDLPLAAELYRLAAQADGTADEWYRLALIEFDRERPDAAAQAMIQLVERWPETLPRLNETVLFQLQYRLKSASDTRLALLRALFDANWVSRTSDLSPIWLNLAEMLVERGRHDDARVVARRIQGPLQLVALRSDKRFDFMVRSDSPTFDVDNAARRQVESLREKSELAPRSLDARSQLSYALLIAGRDADVLALNDEVKRRIADAPADQAPYDDLDERVWVMNNAAIALRRSGRIDEALAELERASRLSEQGGANVSQTLNLATTYCSLERPDDALAALARSGENTSGYARLIVHAVRLCAATAKGDHKTEQKALDYLREHRSEGQQVYLEALLRTQRLDDAARLVAELMASSTDRLETLSGLQDYRRADVLPGDVALRKARADLLAREDVQAAIASVGRIEPYAIYGSGEMD
nr:tetratricopeptide repeat protein [Lysobacter enzymogenes]